MRKIKIEKIIKKYVPDFNDDTNKWILTEEDKGEAFEKPNKSIILSVIIIFVLLLSYYLNLNINKQILE